MSSVSLCGQVFGNEIVRPGCDRYRSAVVKRAAIRRYGESGRAARLAAMNFPLLARGEIVLDDAGLSGFVAGRPIEIDFSAA